MGRNYPTEVPVVGTSVPQEREKENPGIFAVGGQVFILGNSTNQGLKPPAVASFILCGCCHLRGSLNAVM